MESRLLKAMVSVVQGAIRGVADLLIVIGMGDALSVASTSSECFDEEMSGRVATRGSAGFQSVHSSSTTSEIEKE